MQHSDKFRVIRISGTWKVRNIKQNQIYVTEGVYVYIFIWMNTFICTHIYIRTCIYIHVYSHIYAYMYTCGGGVSMTSIDSHCTRHPGLLNLWPATSPGIRTGGLSKASIVNKALNDPMTSIVQQARAEPRARSSPTLNSLYSLY